MTSDARTPVEYIAVLPENRKDAVEKLRQTIIENLPEGFAETMTYGMIGYGIPHSVYTPGYHANPKEPVPFMGLASQKNHIAFYHMGLQLFPHIQKWFEMEYALRVTTKLDMGKGCIRFKNPAKIPYDLVAELCGKITLQEYLDKYRQTMKR